VKSLNPEDRRNREEETL